MTKDLNINRKVYLIHTQGAITRVLKRTEGTPYLGLVLLRFQPSTTYYSYPVLLLSAYLRLVVPYDFGHKSKVAI
jgi:hypothetical protein